MTEPGTGLPDAEPQRSGSRSSVPAVAFALLAPFAIAAYMTSAIALEAFWCGRDAWKSGTLGSVALLQVGVLLIVLCVAILVMRTSTRIGDRKLSPAFALLRTIAKNDYYCVTTMLYCLLVIAALWVNYWQSYYCVGRAGIVVRTSVLASPRSWRWDEVTAVRARCAIAKSGLEGSLTVTLGDGTAIPLKLKTGTPDGEPGDVGPIEAALAGHRYTYGLAPSVTQSTCPPDLYRAFTGWPR